jgi:hypothetical protein
MCQSIPRVGQVSGGSRLAVWCCRLAGAYAAASDALRHCEGLALWELALWEIERWQWRCDRMHDASQRCGNKTARQWPELLEDAW